MSPVLLGGLLVAYLIGSIPFSFLVARLWGVADVRRVGSGNVGATNVLRSAGRVPGAIAFALDAGKGVAAVLAMRIVLPGSLPESLAAVTAVLGHVFPAWLSFRGGKGVATGVGAFLPLAPLAALGGMAVFALIVAATRYVAVASLGGGATVAVLAALLGAPRAVAIAAAGVALLLVWTHRGNLHRLFTGTEARLGRGRPT